ncbi:MAG: hypothetical protein ABIZ49_02720 [Opitutaceae bacterium]
MKAFVRLFSTVVALGAFCLSVATLARAEDKKTPPPRSIEAIGKDLDDLESLVDHLEKNGGTWDATQRASAYARLLALAEGIGINLHRQRELLNIAIGNQPTNDPNGGLGKTVTASQKAAMAALNKLDARLAALRLRIAALDPGKKAGPGPAPGGGGGAGGGGTTVTPSGGTRKK